MINYSQFPNLGRYFEIDELSGQLSVRLQGDAVLDRDNGEDTHDIHINILDNYQGNGSMIVLVIVSLRIAVINSIYRNQPKYHDVEINSFGCERQRPTNARASTLNFRKLSNWR